MYRTYLATGHHFEHHIELVLVLEDLEELHHIGVVDLTQDVDLGLESLEVFGLEGFPMRGECESLFRCLLVDYLHSKFLTSGLVNALPDNPKTPPKARLQVLGHTYFPRTSAS